MTSPILETGTRAVFHTILLFSVFMLFAGHNAPGGGFIGGLIAVSAFLLRWLAEGSEEQRPLLPLPPETLLGAGVGIALLTGLGGYAFGGAFLGSDYVEVHLPLLGTLKATSVLLFDAGVYLVVLGLGVSLVRSLGREADR